MRNFRKIITMAIAGVLTAVLPSSCAAEEKLQITENTYPDLLPDFTGVVLLRQPGAGGAEELGPGNPAGTAHIRRLLCGVAVLDRLGNSVYDLREQTDQHREKRFFLQC